MVEHNFTEAEQHHKHSYAHYSGPYESTHAMQAQNIKKMPLRYGLFYAFYDSAFINVR